MLSRTRRLLPAALAVIALATGAAACGGDDSGGEADGAKTPRKGGTLTLAQTTDVTGFDQTVVADNETIRVLSQITEPLYRADAKGKLIPWLATGYEKSADGRTWTFDIRPGVKFSNGQPLTAEDVAFTLNRSRKSPAWGFLLGNVVDVRAASETQVAVKTKDPSVSLLASIANFVNGIVPANLAGKSESEWAQSPIGTGPFVLASWQRGQAVELERNDGYWVKGRPYLDAVTIKAVPNDNSRVSQLQGGQLDVIAFPPFSQIEAIDNSQGVSVGEYALASVDQLYLNVKQPPYDDPQVRKAIALSIDRQALVDATLFGYGEPAKGMIAPSVYPMDGLPALEPDAAEAKAIVDGLPAVSRKLSIVLTSNDSVVKAQAQILQEDLTAAGFEVSLEPVDGSALNEKWQTSDYGALLNATSSDIVDPSEIAGFYAGNAGIFTNAPTEKVAELAAKADAETDPDARWALYDEIQTVANDEHALISMVVEPFVYGLSDKVAGFTVNPTGIYWLADVGFASE